MDNIRYMCFCRSIFSTLNAFHCHKLCCEEIKNMSANNAKLEPCKTMRMIPNSKLVESNLESKPDVKIKLFKAWTVFIDDEDEKQIPEPMATNLWGRRLPKRTKVPYLSRAVPLSTDHSYEQCPCGAVFVTRLGKRQHQARFCKFVKNKSKKSQPSETVSEGTQTNSLTQLSPIKTVSNEHEDFLLSHFNTLKKEYVNIKEVELI